MSTFARARRVPREDWPSDEYLQAREFSKAQLRELRRLVERRAGEGDIDQFISENRAVLAAAVSFADTGHHGTWVIPKQMIRPAVKGGPPGLIPDFLVGARSSDGFEWWVIELKGANANLFAERVRRPAFSGTMMKGVSQLLTYMDWCNEHQSSLRSSFALPGMGEPSGMLFIGREQDVSQTVGNQKLKSAWNRLTRKRLQVRTYDALLRRCADWAKYHGKRT